MIAKRLLSSVGILLATSIIIADEPSADEPSAVRGKKILLTRSFIPAQWPLKAYGAAWKNWQTGEDKVPKNYDAAFRLRYGLHPAPYKNDKFPMGLRPSVGLVGNGIASDCLMCHGGSIGGTSYIGLGNASLDIQALFEDLGRAGGGNGKTPFVFSNVRGTSEAGGMSVFLFQYRDPALKLQLRKVDLGLFDKMCEDVPAWWLMRKKKTIYYTGSTDKRSVRTLMQFMLVPLNLRTEFEKSEEDFRHVHAYLQTIRAPKYPYPINTELAATGKMLFNETCAKCHGTYGAEWTYPNRIVPLAKIGTDPGRFHGISKKFGKHYNASWFAKEKRPDGKIGYPVKETAGYLAPPLDGIWATAPYFHNGSVPTLSHVLNSKSRPTRYTRSFKTDFSEYDKKNVGWKITMVKQPDSNSTSAFERRKIYDTTQPGRSNRGHTFGDHLTDEQRRAVIEYLKTL